MYGFGVEITTEYVSLGDRLVEILAVAAHTPFRRNPFGKIPSPLHACSGSEGTFWACAQSPLSCDGICGVRGDNGGVCSDFLALVVTRGGGGLLCCHRLEAETLAILIILEK